MNVRSIIAYIIAILILCGCDREWDGATRTVLFYAVDSNLGSNISKNISDIEASLTKDNMYGGNMLVFRSNSNGEAELYRIVPQKDGGLIHETIATYPRRSGIETDLMREVMGTVATSFPADSYGLIFSSHGTAWFPFNMKDMRRAFGENNGQWMEIPDMAEAIPDGMFDFIIFDACSMGAVECAYELKDDCRMFISSPSEILVAGFPFKQITPMLFPPSPDYDKIAKSFNDYYLNSYDPYASISVVDCSRLEALASVTREIVGDETAMYAVSTDTLQILSYINGSPTALYDMIDVITKLQMDESQRSRFISNIEEAVTSAYNTGQHYCSQFRGPVQINTYSGLSIYPIREELSKLNDWYIQLRWYKDVYQ